VRNEADDPIGTLFSFSYLEDDASAARRPVTFVFNGGPGSSSAWLNLGGIGPRRVVLPSPVPHPTPPFEVIDNANSPLRATDLVFIDPVGTGFSRLRGKGSPSDFYGTPQDAATIARFIESWLSEHHRWDSPKFLIGESYGTVRANLLSAVLMNSGDGLRAITLNGVILIGHDGGLVPLESERRFQTNFTTLAAAAWYHNRVERRNRTFEQFIAGAAEFAQNELGPALDAGLRVARSYPARAECDRRRTLPVAVEPARSVEIRRRADRSRGGAGEFNASQSTPTGHVRRRMVRPDRRYHRSR
jgi:carboxypeptidase C (cathepsin A)